MSKRILSVCLALAVLLVALPFVPFGNADVNAAAPGEANPVFTPAQLPETVVDRVIANFDGETDQVGRVNYDWEGHFPTYQAYTYSGANTTKNESIVDGAYKVEFTAFNTENYPTTHIFIDPALGKNPTEDSTAIRFHIDTTGMVSEGLGADLSIRFTLTTSNGTSGVSDKLFVIDGKTWYFQPDATEEDPNPELITKTTRNATSVWNCYLDVPTGVKGTVILPVDAFFFDENSRVTDYALDASYWETYVTDNAVSWRHQSSIALNLRDAAAAGDWFTVDSFEWIKPAPMSFQFQTVTQDFSDFTPNGNWTWIYGNFSCYGNEPDSCFPFTSITADGDRLIATPTDTAANGSRLHLTIDDMGDWKESYKAFSFDLDMSAQKGAGSAYIRPKLVGRKNIDGTLYTTSFAPNKPFYFYNEETGVFTTSNTGDGNTQHAIPEGFKGKIIFPAEIWYSYSPTTETGEAYGLHDDFTELALVVEVTNWREAYNGSSYYIDNFTYYTDLEGPEAGYNFATDKIGYESNGVIGGTINTVEAWVKTSATAAGTIFSDKYIYTDKNYADGWESFQVAMNAAGNPVVYLSAGDGDVQFVDWTIDSITINNGKWNHVAVVVDGTVARFYLNGVEAASKEIGEFNGVQMARPVVLGHTINNSTSVKDWFDGEIAKVAVYGDARNAGEVMLDAIQGFDRADENLLASWNLAGSVDATLKTYDLKITADDEKYATYVNEIKDGSYTIAFLPDTQIVNLNHSTGEFDYFANMYTWIIDKAEDYNIKAVLSLGDITDKNDSTAGNSGVEWANARAAFDRLTAAGIPWTVVQGNHDYENLGGRVYENFKAAFPVSSAYNNEGQFVLGGTFFGEEFGEESANLSSAYYFMNVDADADYEYMVLALEFEPFMGTVEWARQVIQKNSDKKVIITTHGYMDPSATLKHNTTAEQGGYHDALSYSGGASGEDLWEILGKQYANIEMIICGHLSSPDIVTRIDKGVNGNDVLQVCMDSQGLDTGSVPEAVVGLATYNADGTLVSFKYVATSSYRTESGEGDYFYDDNSNELKVNLTNGATTAAYVNKSVDNSANIEAGGLYAGGTVVRDFEGSFTTGNMWYASNNINGNYFDYSGRLKNNVAVGDLYNIPVKWEAGRIQVTDIGSNKSVYFKSLPDFVPVDGEPIKAISIHIENPGSSVVYTRVSLSVPYLTGNGIEVRDYDGNATYNNTFYLISDDGTVQKNNTGTWATTIPANFSGTYLIPLDNNFCQWGGVKGSGNYLYTAEDFAATENTNSVTLQFNCQSATGTLIYDNITYHTSLGDAYTAPVLDKNGNINGFVDVKDGADLDESNLPAAPEKFGMVCVGWANVDIPGAAIYPIYEKVKDVQYTIEATNGTVTYPAGQDYALYNDRVVVEAPTTDSEGKAFAYWTANGDIFSYSNRISFLAFGNANFVAVYADDAVEAPIVFTDSVATIVDGTKEGTYKMQVMGAVQVPEGTTVSEIGILLSASPMDAAQMKAGYEAADGTVVKLKASNAKAGEQFTYGINNIAAGKTRTALTYAILSDGTVVYGNTTCVATMPSAN